jgi:hypothetical protein
MATTSPLSTSNSSNNACQVRVGVRIRPLTSQEAGEGGNSVLAVQQQQYGQQQQQQEIRLGQRRFTYDAVFDSDVSQHDLYQSVSAPLLTSFLDGYNATVRNVT